MGDGSDTTATLLDQLQQGNPEALAQLFSQYRERLRKTIQFRLDYRLRGRVSESDILQETFISASKRLQHFLDKPDLPLFIWLRMLTNQQLADLHRHHLQAQKRDARKDVSLLQPAICRDTSLVIAAELVQRGTSPSGALVRRERIAMVERAFDQMEPIDREVIALRHFEELTNIETAAVLSITPEAASGRYVRAMKRLREIIASIPGLSGT